MADVVQVDEGTGLHLSQNVRTYTYAETAEEGVVQMFKEMRVAGTQWYDFKHEALASTPAGKIGQLLSQDYVFRLLETIVNNSFNHYTHSAAFKISSLMRDLISPTGGVSPFLRTTHNEREGLTPLR
jgi:hypothetical protein